MELLSIGTLVAYTKVTISVLVSRYKPGVESVPGNDERKTKMTQWLHKLLASSKGKAREHHSQVTYQPITNEEDTPDSSDTSNSDVKSDVTESTASRADLGVLFLVMGIAALAIMSRFSLHDIYNGKWWAIYLIFFFSGVIVVSLVAIQLQPQNSATFPFMVCFVPYTPALTITINIVLLANLQMMTYVRFGVWMVLGESLFHFLFYFLRAFGHTTHIRYTILPS